MSVFVITAFNCRWAHGTQLNYEVELKLLRVCGRHFVNAVSNWIGFWSPLGLVTRLHPRYPKGRLKRYSMED